MSKCIRRWKNSLAICIPKAFAEKIGMQSNDELELTLLDGQVVLALKHKSDALNQILECAAKTDSYSGSDKAQTVSNE